MAVPKRDRVEDFENSLRSFHVDARAFIKLFNMWLEMTSDERGKVINNQAYLKGR